MSLEQRQHQQAPQQQHRAAVEARPERRLHQHVQDAQPLVALATVLQIRVALLEEVLLDAGQIVQEVLLPVDRGHVERQAAVVGQLAQRVRQVAHVVVAHVPVAQAKVRHHADDTAQPLVAVRVAVRRAPGRRFKLEFNCVTL